MVTRSDAARDILRDDVERWTRRFLGQITFKFSARHFFRDWSPGGPIVDTLAIRENVFRNDAIEHYRRYLFVTLERFSKDSTIETAIL